MSNSNVDAVKLLGLVRTVVPSLLVENGVEGNGSLSGLTITNNQLTLTTTNGHHGVDRLKTSLDGLVDRVTRKNTGSFELGTTLLSGLDGSLSVDWVSEGIDDTSEEFNADWDIDLLGG